MPAAVASAAHGVRSGKRRCPRGVLSVASIALCIICICGVAFGFVIQLGALAAQDCDIGASGPCVTRQQLASLPSVQPKASQVVSEALRGSVSAPIVPEEAQMVSAVATSHVTATKESTSKFLPIFRLVVALGVLVFVLVYVVALAVFVYDGSLPARLAILGILPEAFAIISVPAAAALLRLKTKPTPCVFLQSCVSDQNISSLATALREHGKSREVAALELPQNADLSEKGLRILVAAILDMGSGAILNEVDLSHNPWLGDGAADALAPLLAPRASSIEILKLADCSLTIQGAKRLGRPAARSKLRTLDLSYNNLAGAGEALAEIAEAPMLSELLLNACELGDEDVAVLAEQLPFSSVSILQLGGNRLSSAGVVSLSEHLPASQVDQLNLECNRIEAGPSLSALGAAWVQRPFSQLQLTDNLLTRSEMEEFYRTLRSLALPA